MDLLVELIDKIYAKNGTAGSIIISLIVIIGLAFLIVVWEIIKGISAAIANGKISLSKMTFSHQMVRLFFVEQVYRAMTILKNEPYHHL